MNGIFGGLKATEFELFDGGYWIDYFEIKVFIDL